MSSFKVGEKVVCVDDSNQFIPPFIKKHEIYTIKDVDYGLDIKGNTVLGLRLKEIEATFNGDGKEYGYVATRFRKLDHQFAEDVIKNLIETSQPVEV